MSCSYDKLRIEPYCYRPYAADVTDNINIGYTMKPRGLRYLEPRGNNIDTRARSARVSIGFQGDLNTVGPEGFIV